MPAEKEHFIALENMLGKTDVFLFVFSLYTFFNIVTTLALFAIIVKLDFN